MLSHNQHDSIGMGGNDVLDVCKATDLARAELYHYFADLFKTDPEQFHLWLNLAMEEENHAKLYGLLARLRRSKIIKSIRLEVIEAEVVLVYVRSLIEKVRKQPPSREEALRLGIDLETKLNHFICDSIEFADSSFEHSFLSMGTPSKGLVALEDACKRILGN